MDVMELRQTVDIFCNHSLTRTVKSVRQESEFNDCLDFGHVYFPFFCFACRMISLYNACIYCIYELQAPDIPPLFMKQSLSGDNGAPNCGAPPGREDSAPPDGHMAF